MLSWWGRLTPRRMRTRLEPGFATDADAPDIITEPPLTPVSEWSISAARSALSALDRGHFQAAARLADAIYADDRIGAVIDTRINAVLGLPYSVEIEDEAQEELAEELAKLWPRMFPETVLKEIMRYGIMLGATPVELLWDLEGGPGTGNAARWNPELIHWHPQNLQWYWQDETWYLQATEGQYPIDVAEPRWSLFVPFGSRRPFMSGLIRRLTVPYLARTFTIRDWSRWSEKHGLPTTLVGVPEGETDTSKINKFLTAVRKMGRAGTIRIPTVLNKQTGEEVPAWSVRYLEAAQQSDRGFKEFLMRLDASIAVAVLGQNLTTEVQSGSLAAAKEHNLVRLDYLRADALALSEWLREAVIRPWISYNVGELETIPRPHYDATPPQEQPEIFRYNLETGWIKVNQMLDRLGLPMLTPEEGGEDFVELMDPDAAPADGATGLSVSMRRTVDRLGKVLFLARGRRGEATGAQAYLDRILEATLDQGREAVQEVVGQIRAAVVSAESPQELSGRLTDILRQAPQPEGLRATLAHAFTLSELLGRAAVEEES